MDKIKEVENQLVGDRDFPEFETGDTVSVDYKIKEGNKERTQRFQGAILQKKGTGSNVTFTIRKNSGGIGVERVFNLGSPFIVDIKVHKKGSVRRSKIFYIREKKGKAARIKEKRAVTATEKAGEKGDPEKVKAKKKKKKEEDKAAKKATEKEAAKKEAPAEEKPEKEVQAEENQEGNQ